MKTAAELQLRRSWPIIEIEGRGRLALTEPLEIEMSFDQLLLLTPGQSPCPCCHRGGDARRIRARSWDEAISLNICVEIEP